MPWPWQKDGLLPLNRRWQTLRARAPKATLRVGVGALILAFALILVLSKPLPFVVDTTDYAIVTAFGKPTQVITSPGLQLEALTRVFAHWIVGCSCMSRLQPNF